MTRQPAQPGPGPEDAVEAPDAPAHRSARVLVARRGLRTRRLLRALERQGWAPEVVDLRQDEDQARYVERLACGAPATPVVEVAGLTLLRPSTREVLDALATPPDPPRIRTQNAGDPAPGATGDV